MLNIIPEGFIPLQDARVEVTRRIAGAAGAVKASKQLREAIMQGSLSLYAVLYEDRATKLGSVLLDKAASLKTGVLTFSHINRGSNPPTGMNSQQIRQLAEDPLCVAETQFRNWLKKKQSKLRKGNDSDRRGPKPRYDWEAFRTKGLSLLDAEGMPSKDGRDPNWYSQADFVRLMADWCQESWGETWVPANSTLKHYCKKLMGEFSERRSAGN